MHRHMVVIKTELAELGVYISGVPEGPRDVSQGRASRGCSVRRAPKAHGEKSWM